MNCFKFCFNFAFKISLRRHTLDSEAELALQAKFEALCRAVGRCRLTLSIPRGNRLEVSV
jgi:hypothetical protein